MTRHDNAARWHENAAGWHEDAAAWSAKCRINAGDRPTSKAAGELQQTEAVTQAATNRARAATDAAGGDPKYAARATAEAAKAWEAETWQQAQAAHRAAAWAHREAARAHGGRD
jgi:hypothetical protein